MGPLYRPASHKDYDHNSTKRTVKYLAICHNPRIQREVLRSAPYGVYKSICNAAFNVAENPDIIIPNKQRRFFRSHHRIIKKLIDPKCPIQSKKNTIQRGGGLFLATVLPFLISTALSYLGSAFIKP